MHNYLFSHVKRSGNSVPYVLARRAQHCIASAPNVWMDTVPSEPESFLSSDLFL